MQGVLHTYITMAVVGGMWATDKMDAPPAPFVPGLGLAVVTGAVVVRWNCLRAGSGLVDDSRRVMREFAGKQLARQNAAGFLDYVVQERISLAKPFVCDPSTLLLDLLDMLSEQLAYLCTRASLSICP